MANPHRQIGAWTIIAIVLLRLAIGAHFFREGTEKIGYSVSEDRYVVAFSAEGFLSQATGPLAGWFHDYVPNTYDWPTLLAAARQDAPGEPVAAAPYQAWTDRIAGVWKVTAEKIRTIPGLSEDQREAVVDACRVREQQLTDYLAGEAAAIKDYQHELWRLDQLRTAPETGVPYMQQRIAAKEAELRGVPSKWVDQVAEFEAGYHDDLRGLLTDAQRDDAALVASYDEVLTDPRASRLASINKLVTIVTIAVGVCLLLGFFTRLASLAGAAFLLAIMATQPPWAPDAVTTYFYYQCVELTGLLVLFTIGAGRWLGIDAFSYALWHRFFGDDEA